MSPAGRSPFLGLIVNPVAGLGGRVGLKGSDGSETQRRALALGALPAAGERAAQALVSMPTPQPGVITCPGEMGANVCARCGVTARVIGGIRAGDTTAEDTQAAALAMRHLGVDLLLFAGGDGTARDVCAAVGLDLPVLGVPAGVKMHSAVFAVSPRAAGEVAARFLAGTRLCREAEVMDLDEEAYRLGRVAATLYGYLRVPLEPRRVQSGKAASGAGEESARRAIAAQVVESMSPDLLYILGPGTTTGAIAKRLGVPKTLVGVDVVVGGRLLEADANEACLLALVESRPAHIVVSPIGGQGFLFGRGNQQIGPAVIRRVGRTGITVAATPHKLAALGGRPFLVDTGDPEVDAMIAGHVRVVTGYGEEAVYRVAG